MTTAAELNKDDHAKYGHLQQAGTNTISKIIEMWQYTQSNFSNNAVTRAANTIYLWHVCSVCDDLYGLKLRDLYMCLLYYIHENWKLRICII